MKMRYALSLFLVISSTAFPRTFKTISNGYWNDSLIWFSNAVPSYSTSDTILIEDSIRFENTLFLNSGALLQIDSGGGLCGHSTVYVYSGALLSNSGYFELDSFMISGGYFENINFGKLRFSKLMRSWNGGGFALLDSSHTCGCAWDTCFGAFDQAIDTAVNAPIPVEVTCSAKVFPSVGEGDFTLEYEQFSDGRFVLYNSVGQLIHESGITGISGREIFHKETLANGIYLWEMTNQGTVCGKGKIILTK